MRGAAQAPARRRSDLPRRHRPLSLRDQIGRTSCSAILSRTPNSWSTRASSCWWSPATPRRRWRSTRCRRAMTFRSSAWSSPAPHAAVRATRNRKVGVIATEGTIRSGEYTRALRRRRADLEIYTRACPLFVPLAEEGWTDNEVAQLAARQYLGSLAQSGIDTLILGCTHYPLLRAVIRRTIGTGVRLDRLRGGHGGSGRPRARRARAAARQPHRQWVILRHRRTRALHEGRRTLPRGTGRRGADRALKQLSALSNQLSAGSVGAASVGLNNRCREPHFRSLKS